MKKIFTHRGMKTLLLAGCSLLASVGANAQYCSPTFNGGCFSWDVQAVNVGCLNWTVSNCSTSDYTSLTSTAIAGVPVAMSVTAGNWCGCAVWVDFDNSGTFDAGENLYTSYNGAQTYTYNFNITVPAGTPVGTYRMRVLGGWGSNGVTGQQYPSGNGSGPCGAYAYGSFDDFTLSVVSGGNVAFAIQPTAQSACVGGSFTITSSSPGNSYQWYQNGTAIAGATDSAYTKSPAALTDTGHYYVVASNCLGSSNSDTIMVHIDTMANDTILQASPVSFCQNDTTTLTVNNVNGYTYTWLSGGTVIPGATASSYGVTAAGTYKVIVTNNSCIDTSTGVVANMLPAPVPIVNTVNFVLSVVGSYSTYQWYRNGVAISGATNSTYTWSLPGHYTVVVTDANGCKGTSAIHTLAVNNVTANGDLLHVDPNPAQSFVNITISDASLLNSNARIWITDVTGKVQNTIIPAATKTTVDISMLPSGVYFVNYSDDAHTQTVKLVK